MNGDPLNYWQVPSSVTRSWMALYRLKPPASCYQFRHLDARPSPRVRFFFVLQKGRKNCTVTRRFRVKNFAAVKKY